MTLENEFIEYLKENKLSEMTFDKLTQFIMKKDNIIKANNFLKHIIDSKNHKLINPRILYASFLINYFHNDLLSSEKNYLEKQVYTLSSILVKSILDKNITNIEKIYLEWHKLFNYWKKMDKENLLSHLSRYHKEIRNIYNFTKGDTNERDNCDNDSKDINLLGKIEKYASQIGGEEAVSHVKTSSKYGMIDNKILASQISQNLKKIFWEEFTKDLIHDPPNFKQYPELVEEIKKKFINILPNLGNNIFSSIINTNLDIDKINLKIKDKSYNLQDIYNLISFCLHKLLELHNKVSEDLINNMINKLDKFVNEKKQVNEIIPYFFRFILEQLEIIECYKDLFKN